MKKYIALMLAFVSVILASCGGGGNAEGERTTEAPGAGDRVIATAEGTDYVIIVENGAGYNTAANELKSACYNIAGVHLWVKNDDAEEERATEILVGATNRKESAEAASGLADDEYVVKWIGNKLCAAGESPRAVRAAVRRLNEECFGGSDGKITVPDNIELKGVAEMIPTDELKSGWNPLSYSAANGVELLWQLYMPKNYDAAKEYSCILYMHSAGVRCDDNSHIRAGEAKFLRNIEGGEYNDDVIIIAPCCPESEKWVVAPTWNNITYDFINTEPTRYMTAVLELFAEAREKLPIDDTRLYTYGMSMGGFAVWDLLTRNPGVFAAAAIAAGAGDPNAAKLMDGTAIWIFHGTVDKSVPVESAHRMRDALAEAGRTDVKYTEFPELGHGIWSATADTEGFIDWMFAQHK